MEDINCPKCNKTLKPASLGRHLQVSCKGKPTQEEEVKENSSTRNQKQKADRITNFLLEDTNADAVTSKLDAYIRDIAEVKKQNAWNEDMKVKLWKTLIKDDMNDRSDSKWACKKVIDSKKTEFEFIKGCAFDEIRKSIIGCNNATITERCNTAYNEYVKMDALQLSNELETLKHMTKIVNWMMKHDKDPNTFALYEMVQFYEDFCPPMRRPPTNRECAEDYEADAKAFADSGDHARAKRCYERADFLRFRERVYHMEVANNNEL